MSELIVVCVIAGIAIAVIGAMAGLQIQAAQRDREDARAERQKLTLQIMSRNASEYAIAQAKVNNEPKADTDPYRESVVGM